VDWEDQDNEAKEGKEEEEEEKEEGEEEGWRRRSRANVDTYTEKESQGCYRGGGECAPERFEQTFMDDTGPGLTQVVSQQIHDHQILSAVLHVGGQPLSLSHVSRAAQG